MKSRKKRIILAVGSICTLLMMAGLIAHIEPFEPRFNGKTVNQWLNFYVNDPDTNSHPLTVTAREIGTNAYPALIAANSYPLWFKIALKLERRFGIPISGHTKSIAILKASVARNWGTLLANKSFDVSLLKEHPDDSFVLGVLDLPMDKSPSGARLHRYLWDPDEAVRSRARKLLKLKYHWDEATYQKHLYEMDHPQKHLNDDQLSVLTNLIKLNPI